VLAADAPLNALDPWAGAPLALAATEMAYRVSERPDAIEVTLSADGGRAVPLAVEKAVTLHADGARLSVAYRLAWRGPGRLDGRWAVQWNLALTAGAAPGRYYRLPDRPSLGSRGARAAADGLSLVDEWIGVELALRTAAPADVAWAPVETVSLSEAGLERIYQGSSIVFGWPLHLAPGETWTRALTLSLGVLA